MQQAQWGRDGDGLSDPELSALLVSGLEPRYHRDPDGLLVRDGLVERESGYDPHVIDLLAEMQARHFWYRGRTRLLLDVVSDLLDDVSPKRPSAIDLGAGACGFVKALAARFPGRFEALAVGDHSRAVMTHIAARGLVPKGVERYQVDLLDLGFTARWDLIFALDVLEHLEDDDAALAEIGRSLTRGGTFVMTAPAFPELWTSNDEMIGHHRRYRRADLERLARAHGLELVDARYFMFLLAPVLRLSRRFVRPPESAEAVRAHLTATHRAPPKPVNAALAALLEVEARVGRRARFPMGTSILGVLRRRS